MSYDYTRIDYWENGHAYANDGVLIMPTLHVTADKVLPDYIMNSVAKGVCAVCGELNCQYINTSSYKKMLSAYQEGKLQLMYNIYWRSFGQLQKMKKPMVEKELKEAQEKDALMKTSELVSDIGEKISEHVGEKYKKAANNIAENIKNFQGKTIRSHKEAMKSLNELLNNPAMKVNKSDREAINNAWKNINHEDTARKLTGLSKAFKIADIGLKVEKAAEKIDVGNKTGNWEPLMLEVESWIVSGMFAGAAMAILAAVVAPLAATVAIPLFLVGTIAIAIIASKIDDNAVKQLNESLIRPAY